MSGLTCVRQTGWQRELLVPEFYGMGSLFGFRQAKKEDFFRNFHDVLIQESFMDGQRLPSNQYLEDEFIEKLR